jgi:hypothetical protein
MAENKSDELRVILHHSKLLNDVSENNKSQSAALKRNIESSEKILKHYGIHSAQSIQVNKSSPVKSSKPYLRSWDEMVAEAKTCTPENVTFSDILTPTEIKEVISKHKELEDEFNSIYSLDIYDYMISGIAGVLGALIDIFLVKVPQHPGFLGANASSGGWLSNLIKEKFGEILPPEKIKELEKLYPVSYDTPTNDLLKQPVPGLYPKTHRFHSLGHDPILGWIFGTRDHLFGELSAIGKDGSFVIQQTSSPNLIGENIFIRIFESLRSVGGHFASDVATNSGLPAPLMPLLMFLQFGSIGKHNYTIAEVSRQMYRSGYDFRHFLATSVPVTIIEVIVRIAYFVKTIYKGGSLMDAIPIASHPKLRTQLFLAHTVATSCNAGKVMITKNPLSINWAQWIAFFRYLLPQVHWLLIGKENERAKFIGKNIEGNWLKIDDTLTSIWRETFSEEYKAIL